MEGEGWSLTGKACYSCNTAVAALFCKAHSAFFCFGCDSRVHNLTSPHARVWVCNVCEQEPAVVTCKADAASLCATCDRHVHSANPLARRHDRHPVIPFYSDAGIEQRELLTTTPPDGEGEGSPLDDVDQYLDLDLMVGEQKLPRRQNKYASSGVADGVVPVVPGKLSRNDNNDSNPSTCLAPSIVEGVPCYYDMDYSGSKHFLVYDFKTQSVSQSVSSSSLEVGVVPDRNTMAEVSTASLPHGGCVDAVPLSGIDREARVMRYREKRKNRKFEKTIRYASRKAYAEKRPRIKGRFVKRTEVGDLDVGYGVVPSF